ncbi:hypothetical protein CEP52_004322 [Fusarium oligoseptatum]|uniref:Amino acid transporter transmembrane domain-containing protein n=1 Tax=Fusarium oligoseptatum TaxID=2604345 RepID=A0A428U4F5_9HYPO|nr:hypothetical protein CEP52_004322 [Fusarium oligoseptatum]
MEPKSPKLMDQNSLTAAPSNFEDDDNTCHPYDAVFGEITEDGPYYRNVGWIGTSALMIKVQITRSRLAAITAWSGYIVGVFKLRHPEIYGIDDVGAMLFGRVGRLNAVSMHGTCTAVFVAVAAIVGGSFASIRTLGKMSWLALFGVTSLVIASEYFASYYLIQIAYGGHIVVMATIAVGIQDRPAAAPKEGPFKSDFKIPSRLFVFAYVGTPAFFSFTAEMREPKHYARALTLRQIIVTIAYVGIGCVVYSFCGSYVASPALGSVSPLIKKISYGIIIPGIVATAMLTIHVSLPILYPLIPELIDASHILIFLSNFLENTSSSGFYEERST